MGGFEIGIASCKDKPIIVFEDYDEPIVFPVPYVNHFGRYKQDNEHFRYVGQKLRYNMPIQQTIAPYVIQCPYIHCNAEYFYRSIRNRMHCPVCRQIFSPEDQILVRGDTDRFMPSSIV
ncbi:MAG: hypothetical protein WBL68_03650 [Nitrososphaeraceae archaeon]